MKIYEKPAVVLLDAASSAIQSLRLHDKNINMVTDAVNPSQPFTSGSAYDLDE